MIINHNLNAMTANNAMNANSTKAADSMAKLSSGLKINKAADNAAGLSISQKMQAQINGLTTANSNAQDGISLLQTAEGGLSETQSILQRMNELATQAANDTNTTLDRSAINSELKTLGSEINHIASSTNFNGINLLSNSGSLTFQIGSTANTYDQINLALGSVGIGAASLKVDAGNGIKVDNSTDASAAISVIQAAINTVSTSRSLIGAYQNRLDHTINNLTTETSNMTTAESNITDTDMSTEMVAYSKNNVLQQAAQSMLVQANSSSQNVLKLLQ
jgi:flagellin